MTDSSRLRPRYGAQIEVIVVKLGFFTACLPCQDLRSIAAWAAPAGFSALEVAAWPVGQSRDHIASHLDVQDFGPDQAATVLALFAEHELTLSAVSYYDNNLLRK